jgi:hypothetical protein
MITGSQTPHETLEHDLAHPDAGPVEEVLRALAAAIRSYRLYERSNPMVERFVTALRQKMEVLWNDLPYLRLRIEEHAIPGRTSSYSRPATMVATSPSSSTKTVSAS